MRNSKHPLVSIITSTLNSENFIRSTLESIRRQIYGNWEHIIVDGGSTDSTIDIINEYKDGRSIYISERDSGIYDAWNKGLIISKGSYVSFLGAGDNYVERGLYNLIEHAILNPYAEFISSKVAVTKNRTQVMTVGTAWSWRKFRRFMNVAHPGSLHSKALYEKFGIYDLNYRIAGDYEFLLRAGPYLHTGYLDEVTATMTHGGVSQSNSHCFIESESAKLKNKSVPRIVAKFDRCLAEAKYLIKNNLYSH